jgi:hypothetical protein
VVHSISTIRKLVDQNIVTSKHPGSAIKLDPLATVIDHLDIPKMDLTGASQLRQEKESDWRAALSRDGNDDIYTLLPPQTKTYCGSLVCMFSSLRHAPEDTHFNITGAIVPNDENLRRPVRKYLLIEDNSVILMNQELSDLLPKHFNMSNISSPLSYLHGAHAFQIINVAMVNRIISERVAIANDFTQISFVPLRSITDFLNLTNALQTFSVMFSVLSGREPFTGHDPQVLVQILDSIQNQVSSLPFSIQADVNPSLQNLQDLLKTDNTDRNLLNAQMAPFFARLSRPSPSSDSAFAAMSTATTPASSPLLETAFYTRQDSRPCPRQQPAQDPRPRPPVPDRMVVAQDRRRESRDSVREPFVPDRTRGSPRPCRADSPPSSSSSDISDVAWPQHGHD